MVEFNLKKKRKELFKNYGHGEMSSHVYQIILLQDKEFIEVLNKELGNIIMVETPFNDLNIKQQLSRMREIINKIKGGENNERS